MPPNFPSPLRHADVRRAEPVSIGAAGARRAVILNGFVYWVCFCITHKTDRPTNNGGVLPADRDLSRSDDRPIDRYTGKKKKRFGSTCCSTNSICKEGISTIDANSREKSGHASELGPARKALTALYSPRLIRVFYFYYLDSHECLLSYLR